MEYSALWVPASRSPLPLHAPPMTRNSSTGWKGDLGFQDAHPLVLWIALAEPPASVTGHFSSVHL